MNEIAVILCVYKNDTLEQFQEMFSSLENQTFKEFDVFVQQDGVIDDNLESYIDDLKKTNQIIYLGKREINKGFAFSLNELINVVIQKKGYHYIIRMDSDDICSLNRIELQYNFMKNNLNIDACGGWIEEFNTNDGTKQIIKYPQNSDDILIAMLKRNPLAHVTMFIRVEFFDKVGLYDSSKSNEDFDLWVRAFEKNCKFYNIQKILVKVRTNNAFFNRRKNILRAKEIMYLKFKATNIFSFGIKGYLYGIAHFLLFMSPSVVKSFLYKYFRK